MNILIVGCGRTGRRLVPALRARGHQVAVLDRDAQTLEELVQEGFDGPTIHGPAIDADALHQAGVESCGAVLAVTGQDEANLIACQLAKKQFEVPRAAARVNNPKNTESLKKLGVDITMCSTEILTRLLEREVETSALRHVMSLSGGQADLTEVLLPTDFALAGQTLTQAPIPPEVVLVSITRNERLLIPRGGTVLLPGDRVLCLARDEGLRQLMRDWKL